HLHVRVALDGDTQLPKPELSIQPQLATLRPSQLSPQKLTVRVSAVKPDATSPCGATTCGDRARPEQTPKGVAACRRACRRARGESGSHGETRDRRPRYFPRRYRERVSYLVLATRDARPWHSRYLATPRLSPARAESHARGSASPRGAVEHDCSPSPKNHTPSHTLLDVHS